MNDRDTKSVFRMMKHIELINDYMKHIKSYEEFSNEQIVIDAVVFKFIPNWRDIKKQNISSSKRSI